MSSYNKQLLVILTQDFFGKAKSTSVGLEASLNEIDVNDELKMTV